VTGVRGTLARNRRRAESSAQIALLEEWREAPLATKTAVLDNGLSVIAHRDRKAPIVAVYVIYRAGSRDEPEGKSGLAHLFEHLMFSGTRRFPGSTFRHLEKIGATSINALAREDYTAYFATVPKSKLDPVLEIEAARMNEAEALLDPGEFERQRDVVRNELRQREGTAYGSINRIIAQHSYPRTHPYSHPADGLIEELGNISFADAMAWQRGHYHAGKAAVIVAGDVAPTEAIERVHQHFGDLAPGPRPLIRANPGIGRGSERRQIKTLEHAGASRVYLVWNVPSFAAREFPGLNLLAEIIAGGINSRLFQHLVEECRIASALGGELLPREFGSQVVLWADAREAADLDNLKRESLAVIHTLRETAPTAVEINRAHHRHFAHFLRESDRLCGPRSKAEHVGSAWIMCCDASAYEKQLATMASLRPRDLQALAQAWLDENALTIEVRGSEATEAPRVRCSDIDDRVERRRINLPRSSARPSTKPRATIMRHPMSPMSELRIVIDGGVADDPMGRCGLGGVAITALIDSVSSQGSPAAQAKLDTLGAQIETRVLLNATVVRLSAPAATFPEAIDRCIVLLSRGTLDDAAIARAKSARLAIIAGEKSRPLELARRLLPAMLYGSGHPCAHPPSGIASDVVQVTGEDVRAMIERWRGMARIDLIVVGPEPRKTLKELA
jgi:zinc protease